MAAKGSKRAGASVAVDAKHKKDKGPIQFSGVDAWMPNLLEVGSTKRTHDLWNMVMLPVMVIMVFDGIIRQPETTFQPYFILFYFIVDTTWLLADPGAVRSPFEIFVHHLACLGIAILNFTVVPEFWTLWPWAILVEVNTVFLIGQRVVPAGIPRLLARLACILTWFPCRFGVPTYMSYVAYNAAMNNRLYGWQILLAICTMLTIYVMQVMWTQRLLDGPMMSDVIRQLSGRSVAASKRDGKMADRIMSDGL